MIFIDMKTESYKNIPNQEEENIKIDITNPDLKEKIDQIKENNDLEAKESEPVKLKSQLEIAMERADEMIKEDESFEEISNDEELEELKQKAEEEKEEYENTLKKEYSDSESANYNIGYAKANLEGVLVELSRKKLQKKLEGVGEKEDREKIISDFIKEQLIEEAKENKKDDLSNIESSTEKEQYKTSLESDIDFKRFLNIANYSPSEDTRLYEQSIGIKPYEEAKKHFIKEFPEKAEFYGILKNPEKVEDISFNEGIASAKSVEEICNAIKTKEAVVGSRKVYEADDLNLMIREIVSGERSLSYMPRVSGIREKVREIREQEREKERQSGNEKIQEIFIEQPLGKEEEPEKQEDDFESQDESESKVEIVSKLGLKTWHKWEMLTDRSSERGFIEKMKKKIEKFEAKVVSLTEELNSKERQLVSEEEKYQSAIGKITDSTILKSFEKVYKDKIDKINKEIEEFEKDRDNLEEKISINKEKIQDSEDRITEIEKIYTDKIDRKISEIKDKYNYFEIEESLEKNKELLNKFIMFLEKTNDTISQIETALENKDLLSKEDTKEIKNRLKNLKKRKKTILKGVKKIASFIKIDSKDLIRVEGKISKLEVLKP